MMKRKDRELVNRHKKRRCGGGCMDWLRESFVKQVSVEEEDIESQHNRELKLLRNDNRATHD